MEIFVAKTEHKLLSVWQEQDSNFSNSFVFQERIARFVSMIPFVSDSAAFPDLCDIWSTSEVGTTPKKEQALGNGSQNKKVSFLFYLW